MNDSQLNVANLQNLTQLWKRMGARTCPVIGMDKFLQSDSWPHRCWLETRLMTDELATISSNINQLKTTCIVPVLSHTDTYSSDLEPVLTANAFEISFEQTTMYLNMNAYTARSQSDLELLTVSSEDDIECWTDIASRSFNYAIDAAVIHAIAVDPDVRLITACVGSRPVATAMLYHTDNITGLHQVGVLPAHRGLGIANRLMNDILSLCRQMDTEYVTLQASITARGLYEKLGFIRQYHISNYQRVA